jgi:hypothetical protein
MYRRRSHGDKGNSSRVEGGLDKGIYQMQSGGEMKTSLNLDAELAAEVKRTESLVREDTATVLRMAIRAGLPIVANRFQAPRPEGYFAEDYQNIRPEQAALEAAFSRMQVKPDR